MAFSKTPRVLINDELARSIGPGPGDYDPTSAVTDKRIPAATIYSEKEGTVRRSTNQKINYLSKKDTSDIQSKLSRSASLTIPRSKLRGLEKQINDLNDKLTVQMESSKVELDDRDSKISILEVQFHDKCLEATEAKEDIERKTKSIEVLEEETRRLENFIKIEKEEKENIEKGLSESKSHVNDLTKKLEEEKEKFLALQDENYRKSDEISNFEIDNDQLRTKLDIIQSKLRNLDNKKKTVESELERKENLIIELKSELSDQSEALSTANENLNELCTTNQTLEADLTKLKLDSENIETGLRAEIGTYKSENEKLIDDIAKVEKNLNQAKKESKKLKTIEEENLAVIENYKLEMKKLQDDHAEKIARNKKTLSKEKSNFKAEINKHLQAITDLKMEVNEIRDEIKKSDQRSLSVEQKLTSEIFLREEMDKLISENKSLQQDKETLIGELNVEKEQIKEMVQIHIEYEDELSQHWEEIVNNVEEIRRLQDKVQISETNNASAAAEIMKIQNEKRALERQLEEKDAKLKYLEFEKTKISGENYKQKYYKLREASKNQEQSFYEQLEKMKSTRDSERVRCSAAQSELASATHYTKTLQAKFDNFKSQRNNEISSLGEQLLLANQKADEKTVELEQSFQEVEKFKNLYIELAEKQKNERFLASDLNEEKSALSLQNKELSKSLSEKENLLCAAHSHSNKKQKLNYLEKLREENARLRQSESTNQIANQKLQSRIRIVEEELRFYRNTT